MTTAYSGDGITFPDSTVQATAPKVGMVNRVINGGMVFDQRNAGAVTQAITYTLDRFRYFATQAGKISVQQVTDAPSGFSHSVKLTVISSYNLSGTEQFFFGTTFEANNLVDFAFGTSGAKATALSFWVKSSITGKYSISWVNSANNYSFIETYLINTADTWEYKTISIPAATGGVWGTGNNRHSFIQFMLGNSGTFDGTAGTWQPANIRGTSDSVDFVSQSNGATFYVTGVQLEKGSVATDFEYVDYGRQLQMCQRYFQIYGGQPGGGPNFQGYGVGDMNSVYPFTTEMRVIPTSATSGNFQKSNSGDPVGVHTTTTATSIRVAVPSLGKFEAYPSSGSPYGKITFSAEL
tara:strand:- start:1747 stop:2799 length:1053 start_codon:yes stop_codon:yes gene_type:complete